MNEEQLYIDGKPTTLCYEQAAKEIREAIRKGEVSARKVRGRWWVCSKWAAKQIADAVDDDRDSLMYSY